MTTGKPEFVILSRRFYNLRHVYSNRDNYNLGKNLVIIICQFSIKIAFKK